VNWDAVAGIGAVGAVLAGLVALWVQMRHVKRSIASATYQEIVRMFDDFALLIIERPELDEAIFGDADEEGLSERTKTRARWARGIRFDWFESVVIQRLKYGVLPDDIYAHWLDVLKDELGKPGMRAYWEDCGHYYHPDLRDEVERTLRNAGS
jgi:hypothetical protein